MVASGSARFDSCPESIALDVMFRGTIFPERPHRTQSQRDQVLHLKADLSTPSLAERLAPIIWERMPLLAHRDVPTAVSSELVKAYTDSLAEIHRLQADLAGFVQNMCEANLEFRQGSGVTNRKARDKALQSKIEEMVALAGVPLAPPINVITAGLVAQPVDLVHRALFQALRDAVHGFVEQVELVLKNMAVHRLVGLLEWTGPNVCHYHFFNEVLIQEMDRRQSRDNRRDMSVGGIRRVQVTELGQHIHRWSRHEHHVMNAFHTTLRNSRVVMPPEVEQRVGFIPSWLQDQTRVIEGDIIRERIIESDYRQEQWSETTTIDVPNYGYDPAIVIDQFVIAGWGPREVEVEQQRRDSIMEAGRVKKITDVAAVDRWFWLAGSIASGIATAGCWCAASNVAGAAIFSIICFYAVSQLVRAQRTVHNVTCQPFDQALGLMIAASLLVASSALWLGYKFNSLPDVLGALGLIAIAIVALGLFYQLRLQVRPVGGTT